MLVEYRNFFHRLDGFLIDIWMEIYLLWNTRKPRLIAYKFHLEALTQTVAIYGTNRTLLSPQLMSVHCDKPIIVLIPISVRKGTSNLLLLQAAITLLITVMHHIYCNLCLHKLWRVQTISELLPYVKWGDKARCDAKSCSKNQTPLIKHFPKGQPAIAILFDGEEQTIKQRKKRAESVVEIRGQSLSFSPCLSVSIDDLDRLSWPCPVCTKRGSSIWQDCIITTLLR